MTTNKVDVICPNCDNPETDFLGIISTEETKTNLYKCLKCHQQFTKVFS